MSSEDSDDEPLSALAAAKERNAERYADETGPPVADYDYGRKSKRKVKRTRESSFKKLPLTIELVTKSQEAPAVVERPADVWLYLKDLNPTGPYSCLLCEEWFVSRQKVAIHYVLNHKKDFCGICRYFVSDREAWNQHCKFHIPWACSQCIQDFPTEYELRHHLSSTHNLTHCRLCHFRVVDNQYDTHLYQKHGVTNVANKNEEPLWVTDRKDNETFLCLLCSKDIVSCKFFGHYMGSHHFTLKCFTNIVSGKDLPFEVAGVKVSQQFMEGFQDSRKYGYVDLDKSRLDLQEGSKGDVEFDYVTVKQETVSDEEEKCDDKNDNSEEGDDEHYGFDNEGNRIDAAEVKRQLDRIRAYKGDEEFDVTLMEIVKLEQYYFDYLDKTLMDISLKTMPELTYIDYKSPQKNTSMQLDCPLCKTKIKINSLTTHMHKKHGVKFEPAFSCRICSTTFDTQNDLEAHNAEEMKEFDDLWICQFCDKEFDNREETRHHLTEHWEMIEYDNCFSPHLGFKCKYCPTLFWNETDRENHQVRVHAQKHKDQFYRCECAQLFSDKIWYIHHYYKNHLQEGSEDQFLLKCSICCIVMRTLEEMRSHFGMEHPEARKLYCSLDNCQFRPFCHRKSFLVHLRAQHTKLARKEKACNCHICGREFVSLRARAAHVAQMHGSGKFRCKICSVMLQSADERKLHYLICHPGCQPYNCGQCGKSFQYKSSLYIHKQQHTDKKESYTCSYCQKVFAKKDSFREHVQIHEGPRHACSYCPMRFVQRSNMLRHERRHTGERPYSCVHCSRTFADKGACNSHMKTHSRGPTYDCKYCGQTFVQKSKLTYHTRRHTGENLETCTVCSKIFTSGCSLREHMKRHVSKELTVPCPLCDRKYQDERIMLRHLRTSHTPGQFACPICDRAFSCAARVRSHVLTHSEHNAYRCKHCPKSYAVVKTMMRHLRKRHNNHVKTLSNADLKAHYTILDPRQCDLGLSEDVIRKLYGPKKCSEELITGDTNTDEDYVTKKGKKISKSGKGKGGGKEKGHSKHRKSKKDTSSDGGEDLDDDNDDGDDIRKESDDGGENSDYNDGGKIKMEEYDYDSENPGLEPTDFVSIKIEPMDEECEEE